MLRKSAKIAMVGTLGLGIAALGSTNSAFAADDKDYESDAKIEFEQNTDPTNPVDPKDPDEESDPDDKDDKDNEEAKKGPLSIDYASSLDFGEQEISSDDKVYDVKPIDIGDDEERAPFVQVTDKRGSLAGWNVTVTQESQLKTGDGDDDAELKGAEITMSEGQVNGTQDTEGVSGNEEFTLTPEESSDVFDAEEDHGAGTFTNSFGDDDTPEKGAQLSVPAGTKIEEDDYSADLTWTLTDAPAE